MSTNLTLIEKIIAKQEAAGLNETEFARKLDMARANWFLLKKGEREMSGRFLSAVMGVFPELTIDILDYMRDRSPARREKKEVIA